MSEAKIMSWWRIDPGSLAEAIDQVSGHILDYALVLAAVGTVTMALVELVKALLRARLFYHRVMIQRWIGGDGPARTELLHLAAGGERNASALCDQPSERMMGQIRAAANLTLDFPKIYSHLYAFLTKGAEADAERWREFSPRIAQDDASSAPEMRAEATSARIRLGNLMARRLDAFQARIEYVWARLNQTVAVVGGAVFLYLVLPDKSGSSEISQATRLLLAVVGGMVAPFAKDVVSALSGLRARR